MIPMTTKTSINVEPESGWGGIGELQERTDDPVPADA